MDSVGMLASLGNRLLLKSAMPTAQQIAVWDRLMVPLSRLADPLLLHTLGKSVLGVWTRGFLTTRRARRRRADAASAWHGIPHDPFGERVHAKRTI